jgi:hypothetical protein
MPAYDGVAVAHVNRTSHIASGLRRDRATWRKCEAGAAFARRRAMDMRQRLPRLASLLVVSAALASASTGCSMRTDAEIAAAEGRTMQPIATRSAGPLRLVGEAFADVPLDPEQRRAVAALLEDVGARHAAVGGAMREAAAELAAQIDAGKLDRAALRPEIDGIADAMSKSQPLDRAAIERLHAMLDIEQRQMLADALEERIEIAGEGLKPWNKWEMWKRELVLTDEQRDAIAHDVIARIGWTWGWEWGHEPPAHDLLDQFPDDDFVLDEVAPPVDLHAVVATRSARALDIVEAALPHLTPSQRKTAARLIARRGDTDLP